MKLTIASLGAALVAALVAQPSRAAGDGMAQLIEANNAFALQLYGKLRSAEGNLIFSPYSISSALAMTYAGARGQTARQMERVLHWDWVKSDLHAQFAQLNADLDADRSSNALDIANSLWPQKKYPFWNDFLDLVKSNYGATITPVDYEGNAGQARTEINSWVDINTHHRIAEIIGPGVLNDLTRLVLVDAIYFKGRWILPFEEKATRRDSFHVKPGATVAAPFMHKVGDFIYGEKPDLQLLDLPYDGWLLEMVILLPRDRNGIGQLESHLTTARLATWIAETEHENVNVALPKFKMSTEFGLSDILRAMGIEDAFNEKADFSGMDGRPHWLYLSAVLHKAFIEVNEKGTEAAAATAAVVDSYGIHVENPPKEFRADHPFLFLIRDRRNGSILFMGRVSDPSNK